MTGCGSMRSVCVRRVFGDPGGHSSRSFRAPRSSVTSRPCLRKLTSTGPPMEECRHSPEAGSSLRKLVRSRGQKGDGPQDNLSCMLGISGGSGTKFRGARGLEPHPPLPRNSLRRFIKYRYPDISGEGFEPPRSLVSATAWSTNCPCGRMYIR